MKKIALIFLASLTANTALADLIDDSKKELAIQMSEFKQKGAAGYVEYLRKNSPLLAERSTENQLAGGMATLEDMCGKPVGYSIKAISQLSENSVSILYTVHTDRCPLYMRQVFYRTPSGKLKVPSFLFNTQPEQVWPVQVLYPKESLL